MIVDCRSTVVQVVGSIKKKKKKKKKELLVIVYFIRHSLENSFFYIIARIVEWAQRHDVLTDNNS